MNILPNKSIHVIKINLFKLHNEYISDEANYNMLSIDCTGKNIQISAFNVKPLFRNKNVACQTYPR